MSADLTLFDDAGVGRRPPVVATGERYGRLVVTHFSHADHRGRHYACRCECGNSTVVPSGKLRNGHTASCGCLRLDRLAAAQRARQGIQPGQRSGRLVVIRLDEAHPRRRTHYWCRCDCGTVKSILGYHLKSRAVRSCGCLNREVAAERAANRFRRHGMSGTATHKTWLSMLSRCTSPTATGFHRYGGAGVEVCARWNPAEGGSFESFLADMGERPKGTSLGRIGDVGNYEPGNCAWQTPKEQGATRSRKHAATKAEQAALRAENAELRAKLATLVAA